MVSLIEMLLLSLMMIILQQYTHSVGNRVGADKDIAEKMQIMFSDSTMGVVVVSPKQLALWTAEETARYKIWKGSISTKNSMEDYRLININKDYNMDQIYEGIEAGISALERCVPDFNVNNNVETTDGRENKNDFVQFGIKVVENYLVNNCAMNAE